MASLKVSMIESLTHGPLQHECLIVIKSWQPKNHRPSEVLMTIWDGLMVNRNFKTSWLEGPINSTVYQKWNRSREINLSSCRLFLNNSTILIHATTRLDLPHQMQIHPKKNIKSNESKVTQTCDITLWLNHWWTFYKLSWMMSSNLIQFVKQKFNQNDKEMFKLQP